MWSKLGLLVVVLVKSLDRRLVLAGHLIALDLKCGRKQAVVDRELLVGDVHGLDTFEAANASGQTTYYYAPLTPSIQRGATPCRSQP